MMDLANVAKNKNTQIATIALNYDGSSDIKELQDLSGITGSGLFHEVKSSSELKEAFDKIHNSLFKSTKKELKERKDSFIVPRYGAPTLTFTFFPKSPDDDFVLTAPDGTEYTKKDAYTMDSITSITIEKPQYLHYSNHPLMNLKVKYLV